MTDKPQPEPASRSAQDASSTPRDRTAWDPVPRGTLFELRQALDARHQRRAAIWVGSAAAMLLAVGLAAWQVVQPSVTRHRLSCPECRNLLHGYASHTLDPETSARVQEHLDRCKSCMDQYAEVRQEIGESIIPPGRLATLARLERPPFQAVASHPPANRSAAVKPTAVAVSY